MCEPSALRRAASLIEVLLVVGVLAVLIGLLLPAVQQARAAAVRIQAANRLRQVVLGLHLYTDSHDGRLPGPPKANSAGPSSGEVPRGWNPLFDVWPYIDGGPWNLYEFVRANGGQGVMARLRALFLSPADPTYALLPADAVEDSYSSFSANMWAFAGQPRLSAGFPDGTSTTAAYAERYAVLPPTDPNHPRAWVKYRSDDWQATPPNVVHLGNYSRRATFADLGHADVVPVTSGNTPVSRASEPGVTFLCRPAFRDDYSHVLQSPYPNGLQIAFFDGSVRFLRVGISESNFWGLVARDGGEVVTDD